MKSHTNTTRHHPSDRRLPSHPGRDRRGDDAVVGGGVDGAVDGDERSELGGERLDARDEGAEGGDGLGVEDGGRRGEAGREDPADALGAAR